MVYGVILLKFIKQRLFSDRVQCKPYIFITFPQLIHPGVGERRAGRTLIADCAMHVQPRSQPGVPRPERPQKPMATGTPGHDQAVPPDTLHSCLPPPSLLQTFYYASHASNPCVKTICEVGFGAGHSTVLYLIVNPTAHLYTFELLFNPGGCSQACGWVVLLVGLSALSYPLPRIFYCQSHVSFVFVVIVWLGDIISSRLY